MRHRYLREGICADAAYSATLLLASLSMAWAASANWLADPKTGCRIWNAAPLPNESVTWSGGCLGGMATGIGVAQWREGGKQGQKYSGELIAGKANGHGVLTFANGDRFDGQWEEDALEGQGTATFSNGDSYKGEWHAGKRRGHGVYTHKGSEPYVYDGGFADDKKFGPGTLTWQTGARFDGMWFNDLPNGFGVLTSPDGTMVSGTWKRGCLHQGEGFAIGVTKAQCGFEDAKP
jgi:hypothetical protein